MPELFEFSPTRSNRAKWALEELGVEYISPIVSPPDGENHSEEHMSVHPLGHVPAYRTADYTMHESVAIVLQLLDEHRESGLARVSGTQQRAKYFQWSIFSCCEVDPNLFDVMKHTMHLPEEQRVPEIVQRGRERFTARSDVLTNALEGRDYLLGSEFSGADIIVGYSCNWAAYIGLIESHPTLVTYYARLQQRPAYQKVFAA